eukprot:UN14237
MHVVLKRNQAKAKRLPDAIEKSDVGYSSSGMSVVISAITFTIETVTMSTKAVS